MGLTVLPLVTALVRQRAVFEWTRATLRIRRVALERKNATLRNRRAALERERAARQDLIAVLERENASLRELRATLERSAQRDHQQLTAQLRRPGQDERNSAGPIRSNPDRH